jgi:superfamily II DNA helicase RecQ
MRLRRSAPPDLGTVLARDAVLEGRDVLDTLPTGGGKSHLLPAGLAVPAARRRGGDALIWLSEDQTDKLELRHVGATRGDSTLTAEGARHAFADVRGDQLRCSSAMKSARASRSGVTLRSDRVQQPFLRGRYTHRRRCDERVGLSGCRPKASAA